MTRPAEVEVPAEWEEVARGGPGPFTTWVEYRGQDGASHVWSARAHRKGHGARRAQAVAGSGYRAYDRLAWWVAVLFLVGSAFFILGAVASLVPSLFGSQTVMSIVAESCYSIGAALYTISVYGQIVESLNADDRVASDGSCTPPESWRWFAFEPNRLGFVWPLVFLIGALVFNYETIAALLSNLELIPSEVGLWWTSLIGGLLFLIAALLQMLEVGNGRIRENVRDVSWQVALWFVIGSIGFTVGALPGMVHAGEVPLAKVEPGALIVKLGFLIGGIAFLVGSWLMLPELDQELHKELDEPRQTN
jgi:hypothetical protein